MQQSKHGEQEQISMIQHMAVSMKENRRKPRVIARRNALATVAVLALSSGCSNDQLPSDTTLSISPDSRTFEITEQLDDNGKCIYFDDYTLDIPLQVSVRDGSGNPIGDVELSVYADWTENTFGGGRFPLALYRDMNGNGMIDEDVELVSGADDDVAKFKTSEFGGSATLLLRMNLSCSYRGQVFVFSEFASASTDIETTPLIVEEPEVEVDVEIEDTEETEEQGKVSTGLGIDGLPIHGSESNQQEQDRSVFGGSW
ncbi:hypothetical protein [Granulosicoccus antarcticus]|uniref:Uncharacterized protein n=1 Tax=Granulosicoccus antarcticus IMCC3135 TaxID=1192854 RepID=A0A2Z2NT76_9GAMM|nr:hypothetical protein [Granulosicoccus antarcticus]ASJ71950.1 hypothetical protein IMCC3135_09265 [Granulosicoccus antarcticus IMCC3135]